MGCAPGRAIFSRPAFAPAPFVMPAPMPAPEPYPAPEPFDPEALEAKVRTRLRAELREALKAELRAELATQSKEMGQVVAEALKAERARWEAEAAQSAKPAEPKPSEPARAGPSLALIPFLLACVAGLWFLTRSASA